MDVYEAIEKRRSIRVYKKEASEEQVQRLLAAGAKAPSAGNRQPWEFIVIDDHEIIDQLAEIKYQLNRQFTPGPGETQKNVEERALFQKKSFENASVVAICVGKEQTANGWLCIENIALAAVADGLGTCIVSYWDEGKKEAEKVLGIPEDHELVCILKIGIPGEEGAPPKKTARRELAPPQQILGAQGNNIDKTLSTFLGLRLNVGQASSPAELVSNLSK